METNLTFLTVRRRAPASLHLLGLCAALSLGLVGSAGGAQAQEAAQVKLTLKNHKFQPAEARAPAGKPISIEITNLDPTPAEFESKTLRVEKVIAAGATVKVQVRALAPGRYRFFDAYHEDTTEGFLVVQ
jgi:plastocyanin